MSSSFPLNLMAESFPNLITANDIPGASFMISMVVLIDLLFTCLYDADVKGTICKKYQARSDIYAAFSDLAVPPEFDTRDFWPHCRSSMETVKFQEHDNCWAHAAVGVLRDRYCIANRVTPQFSVEDLVRSCSRRDRGLGRKLSLINVLNICMGSEDNQQAHHMHVADICSRVGVRHLDTKEAHRPTDVYYMTFMDGYLEAGMELELILNGPIIVSMKTYRSFTKLNATNYIYTRGLSASNDPFLGYHFIKIIGWKLLDGIPYWICVNSWGTNFGLNGIVYIEKGAPSMHGMIERFFIGWGAREKARSADVSQTIRDINARLSKHSRRT